MMQSISVQESQRQFFGLRLVMVDIILGALALIAGYLQYVVYPSIISNDFGETGLSLKLSFLTFRYYASRCDGGYCPRLAGVPAFDFFQLFVYLLILYTTIRFIQTRR